MDCSEQLTDPLLVLYRTAEGIASPARQAFTGRCEYCAIAKDPLWLHKNSNTKVGRGWSAGLDWGIASFKTRSCMRTVKTMGAHRIFLLAVLKHLHGLLMHFNNTLLRREGKGGGEGRGRKRGSERGDRGCNSPYVQLH